MRDYSCGKVSLTGLIPITQLFFWDYSNQYKHWQLGSVTQLLHRVLKKEKSASDDRLESPPGVAES